jgi:hypothetical protein
LGDVIAAGGALQVSPAVFHFGNAAVIDFTQWLGLRER